MSEVDIVRATWRDARALSRLDRRCFRSGDAYGWFTFFALCLWPKVVVLKAMDGGRIVGVVAGDPRRRHGYTIIVTVGVDPDMRGHGIGEQLLRACEAQFDLPRFRLQVRKSNAPAVALYKKLNYTVIDRLPHYYGDGEDAYLMEKPRG